MQTTEANYEPVDCVNGPSAYQDSVPAAPLPNYQDPGIFAEIDDWAFQGVDMAFFDSMMRGLDRQNSSEHLRY
ncbi:hypothetical protein N7540_000013 [Penicillium herquei]|nr:hypothetical protein N7540_000013 [Penicillium herquei]